MIAVGSTNAAKPGDYIVETCSDTKSETYYDSESTDDDDGGYEVLLYEFTKRYLLEIVIQTISLCLLHMMKYIRV